MKKVSKILGIVLLGLVVSDLSCIILYFGRKSYMSQFQHYGDYAPVGNQKISLSYGHTYSGVFQINATGYESVYLLVNVSISVNDTILESKAYNQSESPYDPETLEPDFGDMTEFLYFTYTPQTTNETLMINLSYGLYDKWSIFVYTDLSVNILKAQEVFNLASYILLVTVIGVGLFFGLSFAPMDDDKLLIDY